jgi:hypothetical protein
VTAMGTQCATCGGSGVKTDPDSVARAFFAVMDRGRGAGVEHLRCPDCTPCETCKGDDQLHTYSCPDCSP